MFKIVPFNCPSCGMPIPVREIARESARCEYCGCEFEVVASTSLEVRGQQSAERVPVWSPSPLIVHPGTDSTDAPFAPSTPSVGPAKVIAVFLAVMVALFGGLALLRNSRTDQYRIINAAALSPDDKLIASVHGQGFSVPPTVRIWNVETGESVSVGDAENPMWIVAWSPDGKRLAVGTHDGAVEIRTAPDLTLTARLGGMSGFVDHLSWSPDGRRIASGDDNGVLNVWDAETGTAVFRKPVHSKNIAVVAWSPDGRMIASGGWDHAVRIVNAGDGTVLFEYADEPNFIPCLAWSPDGRRLVSGSLANVVVLFDAEEKRVLRKLEPLGSAPADVAWSPDGRLVAASVNDGSVSVWDAATFEVKAKFAHSGYDLNVAWSPDSTRLAFGADESAGIWDQRTNAVTTLNERPQRGSVPVVGWSRDGKTLTTRGKYDGTLRTWDVSTGALRRTMSISWWEAFRKSVF